MCPGAAGGSFGVRDSSGQIPIEGWAAFARHGERVYRLLGYAKSSAIGSVSDELRDALASFREVTDRRVLEAQPLRIEVVRLERSSTLADLARDAPVPAETLGLINRLDPTQTLEAGTLVKTVRGNLPRGIAP